MKKYILKPIQIELTNDLADLCITIMSKPKLRVCTGNPKNGKTALGYKLLHGIFQQPSVYCNPLYVALDQKKIYKYWNSRIKKVITDKKISEALKKMPVLYPLVFTEKSKKLEPIQSIMGSARIKNSSNFIIVDGFDWFFEVMSTDDAKGFVLYLSSLVKNRGISIFLSCQNEYAYFEENILNVSIEKWHLVRPEYMGVDIVEFGDTRLTIES